MATRSTKSRLTANERTEHRDSKNTRHLPSDTAKLYASVMDHLTPDKRSWNMSRIRGKDTKPEVLVRSMLHRAGYRFRKNVKTLPGKPDIVLTKYKTVIFVHGCFWHRHKGCKDATTPKTNKAFWKKKFERNIANDKKHARDLKKLGWKVITVWSCQLKKPNKALERLENSLAALK